MTMSPGSQPAGGSPFGFRDAPGGLQCALRGLEAVGDITKREADEVIASGSDPDVVAPTVGVDLVVIGMIVQRLPGCPVSRHWT